MSFKPGRSVRPLDGGDVGIALHDGGLEVLLGAVKVHVALVVVAEGVLDQLDAALVVGGQGRDLDVLGHGGKVLIGVLPAQERGGKAVVGGSFLHAAHGVGEVQVVLRDLDQVVLVGSQGQDDVPHVLDVIGAGAGVDVGAAPVVLLRRSSDGPGALGPVPVGRQGKVDAPGRQQEGEHLGGRAHGLVPVVVELALDGLVQIAGVQPLFRVADPLHDLGVDLDGALAFHAPGLTDAVAVQAEGVCIGGKGEIALGFQLFGGGLQGIPILGLFAHSGGVVGAESVQGDVPAVDQQAGAALPGGAALHAVGVRSGGLGEGVLVGQVGVGVDAQVGQGHGHVRSGVGVFVNVVRLGQEDVHLVVGGAGGLVQQGLVQLLLVDAVLVGVDDPVDLGAVLQGGDGAVGRGALHFGVDGFQPGAELVVPAVDVDDLALCRGAAARRRAGRGRGITAAARGQQAGGACGAHALQERAAADFACVHSVYLLFVLAVGGLFPSRGPFSYLYYNGIFPAEYITIP